MNGKGLICLRLVNHSFHEHGDFRTARAEANRLAESLQSAVVVYVPVLMVEPPRRTVETPLPVGADVRDLLLDSEIPIDLPF